MRNNKITEFNWIFSLENLCAVTLIENPIDCNKINNEIKQIMIDRKIITDCFPTDYEKWWREEFIPDTVLLQI